MGFVTVDGVKVTCDSRGDLGVLEIMKKSNQINVRLSDELRKEFETVCNTTRLEPAMVVRACIEAFVEQVRETGEIRLPLAIVPKSAVKKREPNPSGRQPISSTAEPAPRHRAAFVEPEPPAHNRIAKSKKKEPAQ